MANTDDEDKARRVEWLIALIRELPDIEPPPGWEERAMARWQRERRRRGPPRGGR